MVCGSQSVTAISWAITHPDGAWFDYSYDDLGRPTLVEDQSGNDLAQWQYNWDGTLWRQLSHPGAPYTAYSYDGANRLTGAVHDIYDTAYDYDIDIDYNPAGQIISETLDNDATYAFDDFADFTEAYLNNGLNQITSVAGFAIGYDSNANLNSQAIGDVNSDTVDDINTFTYDHENRLVEASIWTDTGSGFSQKDVTLRYDPLGRLYEVEDDNGDIRRLYYSGQNLIVEYDGSGTTLNRYVHGLSGGDDPLVSYDGSSASIYNAQFLFADLRGSIIHTTDRTGNNDTVNTYDEYGVPGDGNTGRFGYTGQTWVPELGMWHYKARLYAPALGRFMQTDPIGYRDGMNIYAMEQDLWNIVEFVQALIILILSRDSVLMAMADTVVFTTQANTSLLNIDFDLEDKNSEPLDQYFRGDSNGISEFTRPTYTYNCGGVEARGTDVSAALAGVLYGIYVHTNGLDPYPRPDDASAPRGLNIPLYGISPSGASRVNPGPTITLTLLSGSFGRGFNQRRWLRSANSARRTASNPSTCRRVN